MGELITATRGVISSGSGRMTGNPLIVRSQKSACRKFHHIDIDNDKRAGVHECEYSSLGRLVAPHEVCHKCAVRFGPECAKVSRFNTGAKTLPCGLGWGKLLICISESRKVAFRVRPTLNQ